MMTRPPFEADLIFVHLSDIHFRKDRSGDSHDEDADLRNELQLDLRKVRSRMSKIDGVLISGDIAFGGKPEEYQIADRWIKSICEDIDCDPQHVLVAPGNHDIDRDLLSDGSPAATLQKEVRENSNVAQADLVLNKILRDETQAAQLFAPMAAYNEFAQGYGCKVSGEAPYWERDFKLSDGSSMRLRGITTTLLSGPNDHEQTGRMHYGPGQLTLMRTAGIRYAIMGHHPPQWACDGDKARRNFENRSFLQMFGHVHDQWLIPHQNHLTIIAGAVHPERTELNWQPRYALVAITALDGNQLKLRIFPRKWSTEELKFIGDYDSNENDYREYILTILN